MLVPGFQLHSLQFFRFLDSFSFKPSFIELQTNTKQLLYKSSTGLLYLCSGFGLGGRKPIGEYFDFFTFFSLISFPVDPKGFFPLKVIHESTLGIKIRTEDKEDDEGW